MQEVTLNKFAPVIPWPGAARGWWMVAVFFCAAVLSYSDRQILTLLIDPMRAELAITDTQVSLLQGLAFALIYSLAGLPLGRAADLYSRRGVIILGAIIWNLATAACAFAHSFEALFVARVMVGIGEACLIPAAMSMLGDAIPPRHRGTAVGVFMLGMISGGGVAVIAGGSLLQAVQHGMLAGVPWLGAMTPWRAVMVMMAAPGALLVLGLLTLREPVRRPLPGQSGAALSTGEVLSGLAQRRQELLPLYLGMGLMALGDAAMGNWIPALLSRRFGMDAGAIAQDFGVAVVAGAMLGVFGGGILADRLLAHHTGWRRADIAMAAAIMALPGAFAGVAGSSAVVVAGFAWWSLFSSAAAAITVTALPEIVPAQMRGVSIAFGSFGNILLGAGLGTWCTPFVNDLLFADPLKVGLSMSLVAGAAGVGAVICFWRSARALARAPAVGSGVVHQ